MTVLSKLPDARDSLPAPKATEYTAKPCPDKIASCCPSAVRHILTELSSLADAIRFPSASNATAFTPAEWARISRISSPVHGLQMRKAPSLEPETNLLPSRLNATELTDSLCLKVRSILAFFVAGSASRRKAIKNVFTGRRRGGLRRGGRGLAHLTPVQGPESCTEARTCARAALGRPGSGTGASRATSRGAHPPHPESPTLRAGRAGPGDGVCGSGH